MKFQLRDRSLGKVMTAHQTFVRLTNVATQQEIIFVAEPDSTDTYKFDLVGFGACSVQISPNFFSPGLCLDR